MLIPSIDLMGGKIVQLVQGEKRALEFDNFEEWVVRFSLFPLVQLIDLDAATGQGENPALIDFFVTRLSCQVGGGIRSVETAKQILVRGARRVIFGSSLVESGKINAEFAKHASQELGVDKLVFAIDSRGGKLAIRGWRQRTNITPIEAIRILDPYCAAFLYTHIDTEGLLQGIPREPVLELRNSTNKQLIVAGGISSHEEIDQLEQVGVDAVVGMALYLGKLKLPDTIPLAK